MTPLAPAIRTVWRVKLALAWSTLLLAALVHDVVAFVGQGGLLPAGLAAGAALIGGTAAVVFVPGLRYRTWRYALMPEELYLERGIFNRVRTIVPLRRIQHLDVSQDLLEREFDLGKLIVHTAGTRSSDVVLPGLLLTEAEALRDEVKRFILADVADNV